MLEMQERVRHLVTCEGTYVAFAQIGESVHRSRDVRGLAEHDIQQVKHRSVEHVRQAGRPVKHDVIPVPVALDELVGRRRTPAHVIDQVDGHAWQNRSAWGSFRTVGPDSSAGSAEMPLDGLNDEGD